MQTAAPLLRVHESDTVAVALHPLDAGTQALGVTLAQPVPQGHKVALAAHAREDVVLKYGQPIGRATQAIEPGEHVHSHNLATALAGELRYAQHGDAATNVVPAQTATWRGYRRSDGRAATRNEIWVLPTVGCVGLTAEEVARAARERHGARIDGIQAFSHPHGCSQLGDDLAGTRALLAGLAANPNAAGVLLLGLGCESNQLDMLTEAVPERLRGKIRTLSSQAVGDELAVAGELIDTMVEEAATARRESMTLDDLAVGLKCGGSDGFSGLTANPLLGRFSDTLSAAGGRVILTEIPEIFGAEKALLDRAVSADVFDAGAGLVNRFKRYYLDQGLPVSENPSPGNLAGGITTLEEKSLGAVQKAGHAPLVDVIDYGEQAEKPGLTLLEAPGNDAVSSTALAAAGATMVLFTTGRGTPLGFPVPTIKVASNHGLAQAKPRWIDFDAAQVLDEGPAATDATFLAHILGVASGEPCAAERSGQRAISVWKRGVTL
ncbi:altronate dehydratase family protein [Sphingobium sufflavum]|uniref:UxaA family hydrolase n=1 Tax=Sphingobium sufflavum TaxID=1129547 RepID=UPI001F211E40|nr:altronate dehydratase family protein [Sphingobium sufflavum]MCE7796763.1 altronate dehydratase family protein [Sphingobium sufflavum]